MKRGGAAVGQLGCRKEGGWAAERVAFLWSIPSWIFVVAMTGCLERSLADLDGVYYSWDDRKVLCGAGLDEQYGTTLENIRGGLQSARDRDAVLILFGHQPGPTLTMDHLEAILEGARQLGLPFFTFKDFLADTPPHGERAGLALTFDDAHVDEWYGLRDLFGQFGARATFFVTRFDHLSEEQVAMLTVLQQEGHAIESHSSRHERAPDFVEEFGLQAYLNEELRSSLDTMRGAGFEPTSFAYPYGQRTRELDSALLREVGFLRSLTFTWHVLGMSDPCPL